MTSRLGRFVLPLLGVLLFTVALEVLRRELHAYHYHEVVGELRTIASWRIALALALTAGSYLALTGYDSLALVFIGAPLSYARVALASFVGYALSHNLGGALLSGGAVRYRLYSAWGLTAMDVAKVVAFDAAAFWLGFLALIGATGLDYEEATFLALVLACLVACRGEFRRRATLLDEPLSRAWTTAMLLVAVGVTWLMLVAYRHVEYANDLWWRFEFEDNAPRSLRASVAAALLLATYGLRSLLRHAPPPAAAPSAEELERVAIIVAGSPAAAANLALLGDKRFLLSASGRAFVMYAVSRRAWVAMSDPVGPPEEARELAWQFRELSDRHGGLTVFYEVAAAHLPVYLDLGLSLLKLGEEARVPLLDFALEGHARKGLRAMHRRAEREGCRFEIVPAERVREMLPDLRAVSDAWLAEKDSRKKGFSLGSFREAYIQRYSLAVVRQQGRLQAFANLWFGAGREELSVDLMRYLPGGPAGLMDYLFVELMLWGRAQGYRWFNFGMAPLAGLEDRALAPLWHRAGAFLFRHGRQLYSFEGLRQYKEKFEPEWTPRYLACPGGLVLPEVLVSIAALVSGGSGSPASRVRGAR